MNALLPTQRASVRRPRFEQLEQRVVLSAVSASAASTYFYDFVHGDVVHGDVVHGDVVHGDVVHGDVVHGDHAGPQLPDCCMSQTNSRINIVQPIPHNPWDVTTVTDNGPTDNRVDIVFVGDGYTSSELEDYRDHVERILLEFFAEEPFDRYATFFNVHRVDVISADSGVDHDPTRGIERDTALDMQFYCGGSARMLCVDTNKASAAADIAPAADQILAIANSAQLGGAGYLGNDLGTVAGANTFAAEITLHEFGHSFAGLADEYDYGGPEEYSHHDEPHWPNASTYDASEMSRQESKWQLWLDEPNVDTFEGAAYSKTGVYRPTANSKMRNLGRPFEQVNVEQLVISAYKAVRPIDDATAAGSYTQDTVFFVDPVDPVGHPVDPVGHQLDIQWYLDGDPIWAATQTNFDAATLRALPGTYELSVGVVDSTDLVRDEVMRDLWMTGERTWTLSVVAPKIKDRLAGDADGDGEVAFRDLVVLVDNYGLIGASWEDGDFDADGIVGFYDVQILAENYGRSRSTVAAAAASAESVAREVCSLPSIPQTGMLDSVFAEGTGEGLVLTHISFDHEP